MCDLLAGVAQHPPLRWLAGLARQRREAHAGVGNVFVICSAVDGRRQCRCHQGREAARAAPCLRDDRGGGTRPALARLQRCDGRLDADAARVVQVRVGGPLPAPPQ